MGVVLQGMQVHSLYFPRIIFYHFRKILPSQILRSTTQSLIWNSWNWALQILDFFRFQILEVFRISDKGFSSCISFVSHFIHVLRIYLIFGSLTFSTVAVALSSLSWGTFLSSAKIFCWMFLNAVLYLICFLIHLRAK